MDRDSGRGEREEKRNESGGRRQWGGREKRRKGMKENGGSAECLYENSKVTVGEGREGKKRKASRGTLPRECGERIFKLIND